MCGIAAIYNYGAERVAVPEEILRARETMFCRGPDDCGYWMSADRRVQLAHRRLSILDLSPTGAQPMRNHDNTLVVSFNGEIYNHLELRTELERGGFQFHGKSDTEVLLHLYASQGFAMVNRLRGMYAFAIWDARRAGLFLARDPLGIKPLYYADDGLTFRAASQVKALLAGGGIDTSVHPAGHVGFFLWGHVPAPHTLYRGVKSLPPGTSLWIGRGGARSEWTFCDVKNLFAAAEDDPALVNADQREEGTPQDLHASANCGTWQNRLSSTVSNTVQQHLMADVPVAVFLSSGLDSAIIAAVAAAQCSGLRTLTLGFDEFRGTHHDETQLASHLARRLGTRHHTAWITRQDFEAQLDRFFSAMDQPTIDGLNTFFVSFVAAQLSLKVALSGLGGDEIFGGYPSFHQIPRATCVLAFCEQLRPLGRMLRVFASPVFQRTGSPKYAGLLEYGGTWPGAYLLRRGLFMPWELRRVMDPELAEMGWNQLQPLFHLSNSVAGIKSPRLKVSCLESCWYLHNQLLRDADWAGLAHSVEIRVPFVDIRFLRTMASLCANGIAPSKADVARACAPGLSDSFFSRPKTGFSVPLRHWLLGPRLETRGDSQSAGDDSRAWARFVYSQFVTN